ncbi:Crp/Fnr family transcriptional regulator [Sphingobacterium sp. UT-1RO-CII-1]|uniref:Crp/Fnr family transcriptional regulator n=1 Tax=Sphingobacterium sp. UT-1RO-CII-1 TaxID=2995225 RepID=UPI00227A43C0|nr:Crp/Fnr family transcriptional regulator [Sphingobacterium sp. UT-1RO-CII-1]MCY4779346.1 Crp/Fnr family transcriptional regulator [Sphingobacterium sp. UT-1RO-CII-1]
MFENIINSVSKYITLTEEEETVFTDLLERREVPKKTVMLREGEVCQFEGYIIKGCVRIYYLNENGFEVTLSFAIEDWWVSDIASFHERKPSAFFIEALEDTEMLVLTPHAKEELLLSVPKFERVFRILVQRNLSSVQDRLVKTISKTATERYLEFVERYPTIPLRVPQYFIASYLGVSPEFVSTIRKRLTAKKEE